MIERCGECGTIWYVYGDPVLDAGPHPHEPKCSERIRTIPAAPRCEAKIKRDGSTLRCLLAADHWPEDHDYPVPER